MPYTPKIRSCGTAKIGTGIYLLWGGKDMFIDAKMQVCGPAATSYIAEQMKTGIEAFWTKDFATGYSIKTQVDMCYRDDHLQYADRIKIIVSNEEGPSYVHNERTIDTQGLCVRFHINKDYDFSKIHRRMAHEFGHLLSLGDQYEERHPHDEKKFVRPSVNLASPTGIRKRITRAKIGWENNIMANIDGIVESRNIEEIFMLNCAVNDDEDF